MKLSNRNILRQFFSNGFNKYLGYISLPLMVLTLMLWGVSQLANAASSNSVENGIEAFKQGDFNRARSVLSQYMDSNTADTKQAQVYMFAMEETPKAILSSNMIKDIIYKSAAGDSIFRIMEARLHLLGIHPYANKQEGLKILESLAHNQGYAAYTLGLYFEGTLDGIKRDEAKARSWYEIAKDNHYAQAMIKLYTLAKDSKISGPIANVLTHKPFNQPSPSQGRDSKITSQPSLQQTSLVQPPIDFNPGPNKALGRFIKEAIETSNTKALPFSNILLSPTPYAEPIIICREHTTTSLHPQKTLGDSLPNDLGQKHAQQGSNYEHPVHSVDKTTKEALTTSYPFLAGASYWGDFLYQRKMKSENKKIDAS